MSALAKKFLIMFVASSMLVALILCLVPIEIFNGQAVWVSAGKEIVLDTQISLSYLFGIGIDKDYYSSVQEFRLTGQGWFMAFICILGIPGLLSYRFYLKAQSKQEKE